MFSGFVNGKKNSVEEKKQQKNSVLDLTIHVS